MIDPFLTKLVSPAIGREFLEGRTKEDSIDRVHINGADGDFAYPDYT